MHRGRGAGGGRGACIDGLIVEQIESKGGTQQKFDLRLICRLGRLALLDQARDLLGATGTTRRKSKQDRYA